MISLPLTRRSFLRDAGLFAVSSLLPRSRVFAASTLFDYDFRGSLPAQASFKRGSAATYVDTGGLVRYASANQPRFVSDAAGPKGILVEGAASNLVKNHRLLDQTDWATGAGVGREWKADVQAPDGSLGVFLVTRPVAQSNSELRNNPVGPSGEGPVTVSVWLRSPAASGTWRIRLMDYVTYQGFKSVVEVGPEWKRYTLTWVMDYRDTGNKKFKVLENWVENAEASITRTLHQDPHLPYNTPLTLDSVYAWGAQLETGNLASALVPTAGAAASRSPDDLRFPGSQLSMASGRVTFFLPDGGRRGGVILGAGGYAGGMQLEYTASGFVKAMVSGVVVEGATDVTADSVVCLEWSAQGLRVSSGNTEDTLVVRAARSASVATPVCTSSSRLGLTPGGTQPLGRVIQRMRIDEDQPEIVTTSAPNFVPAGYSLSFEDLFTDSDVSRINENATGGKPGAPAWRSRYRQDRDTVINNEKQIYMDPAFAGTAGVALGVQPFSINNGVLRITANKADPVTVSPYIWNYAYTSGCITSELSFSQQYGYFQMRARCPRGKGFWPAFWLLPLREAWPPEIDILEGQGHRTQTVNMASIGTDSVTRKMAVEQAIDSADGFHVYALEWTADRLVWFVDGKPLHEQIGHDIHEPMYVLINLALGSDDPNWIPDPDSSTPLPASLEVDYVRVFQVT